MWWVREFIPAYKYLFTELTNEFPGETFAFHVHNDIGMGAASLYAALEGGVEILDASVNGLGERAGIASLAEVAAVLQVWYGLDAGIHLDKMKELSDLVADLTKCPIPTKQPCVGAQAFSRFGRSALPASAGSGLVLQPMEARDFRKPQACDTRALFRPIRDSRKGKRVRY